MNSDSSENDDMNSASENPAERTSDDSSDSSPDAAGVEFISDVQTGSPFVVQIAGEKTVNDPGHGQKVAPSLPVTATLVLPPPSIAPIADELSNISAIGGAVGAVVLGVWSILCSLITPFSAINAILALLLGAYGITSNKKKLAVIGIVLGVIGFAMSLIETNEILNNYFAEEAVG